jgi:hypothetical protein
VTAFFDLVDAAWPPRWRKTILPGTEQPAEGDAPTLTPEGFLIGLDLGQASDYTALAVVQHGMAPAREGRPAERHYGVTHLDRWRHVPYPESAERVRALCARPKLTIKGRRPALIVDGTGVGAAVVDHLRAVGPNADLTPILITAGHAITDDGAGGYHVPKKELVATVQVVLQSKRLRISKELPTAGVLTQELSTFRTRITLATNEVYGTWREGDHDDTVLAVALACWVGEHAMRTVDFF